MKIKSLAAFLTLSVAMVMLSGCSKENPTFEVVPASSQLVCKVNVDKLADAFDIKLDGSTVVLPDYIPGDVAEKEKLEIVAKIAHAIDSPNLVMFGNPAKNAMMATVAVTDEKAFTEVLDKEIGDVKSEDGFKVWSANGTSVLSRDSRAWVVVASDAKAVKMVKESLDEAANKSIADYKAVCEQLSADAPLIYGVSMPDIFSDEKGKSDRTIWTIAKITTEGCAVNGTANYIYSDGADVKIDWFEQINTSVLNYVPSNPVFTAACGISDKIDWNKALNAIASSAGLSAAESAQIGIVEPYLSALDGTIMMSVGYDNSKDFATAVGEIMTGNVSSLRAIMMVHYNQAKLNELINMANTFAPQAGLAPEQVDTTLWRVNLEGVDIYYGAVDGYLTIATYRPEPTSGSSLAARFNGKQSAVYGEIASFAGIDPSYDFGVTLDSDYAGDEGKFSLRLTGVDGKFFPVLIKKLSK